MHGQLIEQLPKRNLVVLFYRGDHAVYVMSKNAACDVRSIIIKQHGMKNAWFRFPPVYGVVRMVPYL